MDTSAMARALGRRGGLARARRLTGGERQRIAALGARARMESLTIAHRIEANAAFLTAALELAPPPKVRRVRSAAGPLPDISGHRPQ